MISKKVLLKNIFYFVFGAIFVVVYFCMGISFAEDDGGICNACGGSISELQEYQNFVYEVLDAIDTVIPKGNYLGFKTKPGLFEAGYYKIPKETNNILNNFAKKISDNMQQTAEFAEMALVMAGSMGGELMQSAGDGFILLFKPKAFVLAYSNLIELDTAIHDKLFDLGMVGAYNSKLTDINRVKLEQILKKYSSESDSIFVGYNISDDIRYSGIITFLWQMNSLMKNIIANGGIVDLSFDVLPLSDDGVRIGVDNLNVNFQKFVFTDMDSQFECVRQLKCSQALKNFKEDFEKMGNDNKNSMNKSWDMIKNSIKDLGDMFSTFGSYDDKNFIGNELTDEQKDFLDKQKDLFRSLYGIRSSEVLDGGLYFMYTNYKKNIIDNNLSIKDNFNEKIASKNLKNLNKKKDKISQVIQDGESVINDLMDGINQNNKDRKTYNDVVKLILLCFDKNKEKSDLVKKWLNTISKDSILEVKKCSDANSIYEMVKNNLPATEGNLVTALKSKYPSMDGKYMKESFDRSFDQMMQKQKLDLEIVKLNGNRDVTMFFTEILNEISLSEKIIGSKDTDGIVKYLGNSCELQCENKGGLCYY